MIKQKNVTVLIRSIAQTGLMFALMVILMIIEGIFPPIPSMPPGVKLGLSNVVIMFSLLFIGIKRTALLVFLKVSFVFITRGSTPF
ncbi:MAG: Gx transporter family protein, partial [Oscillospiraceae bacterium]